jgi:hypothetical protein
VTVRACLSFELDVGRLERGDVAPAQLLVCLRTQIGMEGDEPKTTERWIRRKSTRRMTGSSGDAPSRAVLSIPSGPVR